MKDKKSSDSRRKLLKSIAAGGGAVIAGKSLPENWTRPVIESVLLPAHAQTSPGTSTRVTRACGTLPLGAAGEIIAEMTFATSQTTGLALLDSGGATVDFPIGVTSPLNISQAGLADDTYSLIAGVISATPLDVTVTLTTEGGTQVFNVSVPNSPIFPDDFTRIADITIPGGACPAITGTFNRAPLTTTRLRSGGNNWGN